MVPLILGNPHFFGPVYDCQGRALPAGLQGHSLLTSVAAQFVSASGFTNYKVKAVGLLYLHRPSTIWGAGSPKLHPTISPRTNPELLEGWAGLGFGAQDT